MQYIVFEEDTENHSVSRLKRDIAHCDKTEEVRREYSQGVGASRTAVTNVKSEGTEKRGEKVKETEGGRTRFSKLVCRLHPWMSRGVGEANSDSRNWLISSHPPSPPAAASYPPRILLHVLRVLSSLAYIRIYESKVGMGRVRDVGHTLAAVYASERAMNYRAR